MSFQYPFVYPHLTIYHSNVSVNIILMSDVGTPTWVRPHKEKCQASHAACVNNSDNSIEITLWTWPRAISNDANTSPSNSLLQRDGGGACGVLHGDT